MDEPYRLLTGASSSMGALSAALRPAIPALVNAIGAHHTLRTAMQEAVARTAAQRDELTRLAGGSSMGALSPALRPAIPAMVNAIGMRNTLYDMLSHRLVSPDATYPSLLGSDSLAPAPDDVRTPQLSVADAAKVVALVQAAALICLALYAEPEAFAMIAAALALAFELVSMLWPRK